MAWVASRRASTRMLNTGMSIDTLLFGGSFDPVHIGHLYIIRKAFELTGASRIIVMPASLSNFKQGHSPAPAADRLAMLRLALEDFEVPGGCQVVISDWELSRGGVSYSYDTVVHVRSSWAVNGRLGFLIGDDLLPGLPGWWRWDELRRLVTFVCFTRGGVATVPDGADVLLYEVEACEASSSAVRAGDLSLLPPKVARYVETHGLYDTRKNSQGS